MTSAEENARLRSILYAIADLVDDLRGGDKTTLAASRADALQAILMTEYGWTLSEVNAQVASRIAERQGRIVRTAS